jgi:O-antigen/teichoic acid export membrane protein
LFAAPCASVAITPRLDWAVAAVVLTRLAVLLAHAVPAHALAPMRIAAINQRWAKPLLTFGGWLTVSNIVGPMIVHLDRFVVAAVLSSSAVAYYAAPFDVVSRLLLIPTALTAALFPALAHLHTQDAAAARTLRYSAQRLTFATVIVVVGIGIVAARPALTLWLGQDFAAQSARAMQILLVGFAFNAMAQIPFTTLHSLGCTRQTALLHLLELLPFVGLLLLLVRHSGIEGAAVAWSLRAFLDFVALTWMARAMERQVHARPVGTF